MLPIGDDNTYRRTFPIVTYGLIALNLGAFFVELGQPGLEVDPEQDGVTRHAVTVTLVMLVLDFALAVFLAALLSRTRWSKALVGRPRRR